MVRYYAAVLMTDLKGSPYGDGVGVKTPWVELPEEYHHQIFDIMRKHGIGEIPE